MAVLATVLAALLLGCFPAGFAQQIPYTVQVAALSDRDAALTVVSDLLARGYPAYVVRSTSPQGEVFRVRAGAFANRLAALQYAEAMPEVAGGQPVPALAEAIPPGITPLAPRALLARPLEGTDVRLIEMAGRQLLRLQPLTPLGPAQYATLTEDGVELRTAWQFGVDDAGVTTVVREMSLWPDTWEGEEATVLERYMQSSMALVAEKLRVPIEQVAGGVFGGPGGVPKLVVVERSEAGASATQLLGFGLPSAGFTAEGPQAYVGVRQDELPGVPDGSTLADLAGPEGEPVMGDGWQATADGPYVRLAVVTEEDGAASQSWRAALGSPIWSDGSHLLATDGTQLILYDFLPRD